MAKAIVNNPGEINENFRQPNSEAPKIIENHKKAAAHHLEAAKHHLEAVKHLEAGEHDKARASTLIAHRHANSASEHQTEDTKHRAENTK